MKEENWKEIQKNLASPVPRNRSEESEKVELELEDEMFIALALEAHRKNMKFNDYLVMTLQQVIDEEGLEMVAVKVEDNG